MDPVRTVWILIRIGTTIWHVQSDISLSITNKCRKHLKGLIDIEINFSFFVRSVYRVRKTCQGPLILNSLDPSTHGFLFAHLHHRWRCNMGFIWYKSDCPSMFLVKSWLKWHDLTKLCAFSFITWLSRVLDIQCWFVSLGIPFVLRFIREIFFRQSVRGFASHQCKFHFDSMYGVLFRNIERQKNHRNFFGDRLDLRPSIHTLQMVNNNKDKNGSVKLIEFPSLLDLNSHRWLWLLGD